MLFFSLTAASVVTSALAAVSQSFVAPSTSPFDQTDNYVGRNNGTLINGPVVPGAQFDRFIQSESRRPRFGSGTDLESSQSSWRTRIVSISSAQEGIPDAINLRRQHCCVLACIPAPCEGGNHPQVSLLRRNRPVTHEVVSSNYDATTHPSQGNYVAVVSGSTQNTIFDDLLVFENPPVSASTRTIVDLLESKGISWASYAENQPSVGFRGLDYSSKNCKNLAIRWHRRWIEIELTVSILRHQWEWRVHLLRPVSSSTVDMAT
jgi:hypothetical protein